VVEGAVDPLLGLALFALLIGTERALLDRASATASER
jgi:hypothetical protein